LGEPREKPLKGIVEERRNRRLCRPLKGLDGGDWIGSSIGILIGLGLN